MASRQSALGKRSDPSLPPTLNKEEAPLFHLFQLLAINLCPCCWAWWHKGLRSGLVETWEEAPPNPVESLKSHVGLDVFLNIPLLLGVVTRGYPMQSWGIRRKESVNPPLLQAMGTTHNMGLSKLSWPGSEYPHRAQFHGGRESSSEQGHSK